MVYCRTAIGWTIIATLFLLGIYAALTAKWIKKLSHRLNPNNNVVCRECVKSPLGMGYMSDAIPL